MKIKFEYTKFTFGGLFSCIYFIPTVFAFLNKDKSCFLIEFRFLNLSYNIQFYKEIESEDIWESQYKQIPKKGDQK